jgi:hypothetical protein
MVPARSAAATDVMRSLCFTRMTLQIYPVRPASALGKTMECQTSSLGLREFRRNRMPAKNLEPNPPTASGKRRRKELRSFDHVRGVKGNERGAAPQFKKPRSGVSNRSRSSVRTHRNRQFVRALLFRYANPQILPLCRAPVVNAPIRVE